MKQGTYGQELDFFCKNADGTVMRGLDAATSIKIRLKLNDNPIVEGTCTLVDEELGQVQYTMTDILTEEGELYFEILPEFEGKKIPCETGMISIEPNLENIRN